MSGDEAAVSFVVDYEISGDDLREQEIVRRSAAWRAKSLWSRLIYPVGFLLFVAATASIDRAVSGCFIPQIGGGPRPLDVWFSQCGSTLTPNDLLWQNGVLSAGTGVFFVLTLTELAAAWPRPPRWLSRMSLKRYGLPGRYRYEFAADGMTLALPDGAITYIPWPVLIAVRETRGWFLLHGGRYGWAWVLPKRALADPSSVQQFGEFLRASVGRESPPA